MNDTAVAAARCFVPQTPTRYDKVAGVRRPTVDLSPAKKFGELTVCLPSEMSPYLTMPAYQLMEERMRGFTRDDFLIAIGDPILIGMAFRIAARKTGGKFTMLKWERFSSEYLRVNVEVPA